MVKAVFFAFRALRRLEGGSRQRRVLLGGLAAAALPAQEALARRSRVRLVGAGLPGRGAGGAGVLTQGELERCVRLEHEINAAADAIEAEEAAVNARRAEVERLGQEIDEQAARVDRASQAAVKRHNRLVEQQRSAATDFNARLPAFNARVERHTARVRDFNAGCATQNYYEADMRTVRARLLLD